MKNLNGNRFIITIMAVILALSESGCKKELAENFQPITITAVMDNDAPSSKVDIFIDKEAAKAQVRFTAGDVIIVWDGGRNTQTVYLTEDNINSDGTATFTITIDTTSGTYYALATDQNILSSYGTGDLGIYGSNSAFNNIAQGRIPHASWAECSKDDRKMVFKNKMCLFRFDTISDDATTMVFTGNNDEDITGCINFKRTGSAKLYSNAAAECEVYKSITVNLSYWDDDCYFAIPGGITFEKGFTMIVYDSNKEEIFRARTTKSFTTTVGKLWNLGTLEMSSMTPYELWQEGYSLDIGGVKCNKETYGEGTLVEKGGVASGAGVFFIQEEATVAPAYASGTTFYISNNPYAYAKITGDLQFGAPEILAFNNIEMCSPVESTLLDINNKVEKLVFDDCKVTLHNGVLDRNTASKYIKELTVLYSKFIIDIAEAQADKAYFINTGAATSEHYKMSQIKMKHNAFWSSQPSEFRIVRSDGITDASASEPTEIAKGVRVNNLYVENNTFYNVDNSTFKQESSSGYRPFFMLGTVSGTLSISANLIYSTLPLDVTTDGTPVDAARVANILRCYYDTEADNITGKLSSASSWYGLDSKVCRLCICTNGSGNPTTVVDIREGLQTLTEDPFRAIDLSENIYKKKSAYSNYGAEL